MWPFVCGFFPIACVFEVFLHYNMHQCSVSCYGWITFHCVHLPQFVYPSIHWWALGLFPPCGCSAAVNVCVCVLVWVPVFSVLGVYLGMDCWVMWEFCLTFRGSAKSECDVLILESLLGTLAFSYPRKGELIFQVNKRNTVWCSAGKTQADLVLNLCSTTYWKHLLISYQQKWRWSQHPFIHSFNESAEGLLQVWHWG